MLSALVITILIRLTVVLVGGFILSSILPNLSNKVLRFVTIFAVLVAMILVYHAIRFLTIGQGRMGWIWGIIIAAPIAIYLTFWGHNQVKQTRNDTRLFPTELLPN